MSPDGVMLSNGPGDPDEVDVAFRYDQRHIRKDTILWHLPWSSTFALSQGATSFKMKFGHRGANHPVKDLRTGKIDITSQNHGYSIDCDSLKILTLKLHTLLLNDGTVEGLRHKNFQRFQSNIILKQDQVQVILITYLMSS